EMEILEAQIRDLINRQISRGRLTVRVSLHAAESPGAARMHINLPLAKAYARELAVLARQLKLPSAVTLDHLTRAPGVLQTDEQMGEGEDFWRAVKKALENALRQLIATREREGSHLAQDLAKRISIMESATSRVRKQAPRVAERYRQQLIERIKS